MAVAHGNDFLVQACLYFAAAVAAVMISHRLRLGSVAGYLLAGIAIGPWGFGLVQTVDHIGAEAGRARVAQASKDAACARRTTETFAEHDVEVVAKLYEVHRNRPDKHVTVSNELRDQLARTLSEDQRRMAVAKPQQS